VTVNTTTKPHNASTPSPAHRRPRHTRANPKATSPPQHTKLLDDFDHRLAAIVVPPAAAAKARALAAYITFANKLDAARLRAARHGAAAYQREVHAEQKSAASDPSIAARDAAGFSESCNAR
jgi:hypothetical protein